MCIFVTKQGLQDILEDGRSDFGDEGYIQDDDLGEEIDINTNIDGIIEDETPRPETMKTVDSNLRGSSKAIRLKQSRPRVYDFSASNIKRDLALEQIIESRKAVIIENEYTNLVQSTSQARRTSPHARLTSVKLHTLTHHNNQDANGNNTKNQGALSRQGTNTSMTTTLQFDNDKWDDNLNTEFDKRKFLIMIKTIFEMPFFLLLNRKYGIDRQIKFTDL